MPNWHWFLNLRVLELACIAILVVEHNTYYFLWQRRWNADTSHARLSVWKSVEGYLLYSLAAFFWATAASFSFMGIWSWTHSLRNTLLIWDLPILMYMVAVYLIPGGRAYIRRLGKRAWVSMASLFVIGFPVCFCYAFLNVSLKILWVITKDPVFALLANLWRGIKYNAHRLGAMCWNFGNGISVRVTNLRYAMSAGLLSWLTGSYVQRGYRHRTYRY